MSSDDTDRTTVSIEGPCYFLVDVTEEELERLERSDKPFSDMPRQPKEWGPLNGEWSVLAATDDSKEGDQG